jgi:hypothetical protein
MILDEEFVKRLKNSNKVVFIIAQWLHAKNYDVKIPANRESGPDEGDIFISKNGETKRVEVKGRNVHFTSNSDWPYPDMLVSNESAVDRAVDEKPTYIIVNKNMDCIAIIVPETKPHWRVIEKWASNTRKLERFYTCPLEHVLFLKIRDTGE